LFGLVFCSAEIESRALCITRQSLYHQATFPAPEGFFCFILLCFFETRSSSVAQVDMELSIFLSQTLKC
jgi:hypothetical protein